MRRPNELRSVVVVAVVALAFSVACQAAGEPFEPPEPPPGAEVATFAGGCFWCMEGPFDVLDGVYDTVSGYTGGHLVDPSYEQVTSGRTGHTEVVQVVYDPEEITYEELLEIFWHNIDPTTPDRQFCDRGSQYRSGIFVHDDDQRELAEASKASLVADPPFEGSIVTEITDFEAFFAAEEYHQDFYLKNPARYRSYRTGCGRDARLRELWGEAAGH